MFEEWKLQQLVDYPPENPSYVALKPLRSEVGFALIRSFAGFAQMIHIELFTSQEKTVLFNSLHRTG